MLQAPLPTSPVPRNRHALMTSLITVDTLTRDGYIARWARLLTSRHGCPDRFDEFVMRIRVIAILNPHRPGVTDAEHLDTLYRRCKRSAALMCEQAAETVTSTLRAENRRVRELAMMKVLDTRPISIPLHQFDPHGDAGKARGAA